MHHPQIATLYKYVAVSERTIAALRTGAFWFPNPRSFNDPFDCGLELADDAIEESVRDALATLPGGTRRDPAELTVEITPDDVEAYREFRERVAQTFRNTGVFCLTEVATDILMWAHYADSHSGFCIGFERTEANTLGQSAAPVEYRREYPRLSAVHFNPITNPRSVDVLWLTKAADWAYEHEWRMMASECDRYYTIDAAITHVIFGLRMSDADRRAVRTAIAATSHRPMFFAAKLAKGVFAIELDAVAS